MTSLANISKGSLVWALAGREKGSCFVAVGVDGGFVYLAESVSVIIQRYYCKATHGKRFFRMTPIHHHFELGGWSEPRVVIVFTVVCFWTCVLAYLLA